MSCESHGDAERRTEEKIGLPKTYECFLSTFGLSSRVSPFAVFAGRLTLPERAPSWGAPLAAPLTFSTFVKLSSPLECLRSLALPFVEGSPRGRPEACGSIDSV